MTAEAREHPPVSTDFPFDVRRGMSPRTALERVHELEPEQSVALMLHYGSVNQALMNRVLYELKRVSSPGPDQSLVKLRTAAHYIGQALAFHVQDLRATFDPDSDPAVISLVGKIGKLVEGLKMAVDASRPAVVTEKDAGNAIETFLDSEAGA